MTFTQNGTTGLTVVNKIGSWTYNWSNSGTTRTMNVSGPAGYTRQVVSDMTTGRPTSDKDANGAVTRYEYDAAGRLTKTTAPEGNAVQYSYDARGNVTQTQAVPKGGGTPITTSAGYDASCANPKICNQPVWTIDARGFQTDYRYEGGIGATAVVTMPAGANGLKPELRSHYIALPGTDGQTVYKPSGTFMCQTTATCAGTVDETRRILTYDGNGGNNLLPISTLADAGDGSAASRTTLIYDAAGNVVWVDGPLPGGADTTRFYYDAARQVTGSIAPDTDGTGPKRSRAVRYGYNADGQVVAVQHGTALDQSDGGLSAMTVLHGAYTGYFDNGLKANEFAAGSNGAYYAVSNYDYDGAGRLLCSAQRMNPGAFTSFPHACSLGSAGAFGPDRITRNSYDAGGRLTHVQTGYGTGDVRTEVSNSWTANGQLASVSDAAGHLTSYEYDGYDRLRTTRYPNANGAGSSGTDYESYDYDAGSNLTTRRLRDGQVLRYTYDALNRLTLADHPGTNVAEADHMFSYDNLGRLTEARDANGWYGAFAYDAQSRVTRQWSNVSSNSLQYDEAGRRIRQTWSDGFSLSYAYYVTGELGHIAEASQYVPLSIAYDDFGRRTHIYRSNGVVTTYGYDPAFRLGGMTHNLPVGAVLTLNYGYNPAGQITTRSSSNDLYAYNGSYDVNRGYTANGLNQYTASGQVAPSYDGRGNVTQAGGQTFQYTTRNQLFTDRPTTLFYRNPLGLLNHVNNADVLTNFDYVGSQLAAEYDGRSGALKRRYVFDPTGGDELLLQYEGSGTNSRLWSHADERGSIVALTDQAGNPAAINSYDEYGIPGSGNVGRFQYTGQMWIPELGMYDYKARTYSPTLGRFLQTDPIGYGDGMNMYNYVGSDPVNGVDPTGTCAAGMLAIYTTEGVPTRAGSYSAANNELTVSRNHTCIPYPRPNNSPSSDAGEVVVTARPQSDEPAPCGGKPQPPASRTYPIPKGYTAGSDKQNRFVNQPGKQGLQINPLYAQAMRDAGGTDWKGVGIDLLKIAGSVAFTLRAGEIGGSIWSWDVPDVLRAAGIVGSSGVKATVDVAAAGQCDR